MKLKSSVWDELDLNTFRRVKPDLDMFWVKSNTGKLFFKIELPATIFLSLQQIKLKGMELYSQEIEDKRNILLSLSDIENEDIFNKLCMDLVELPKDRSIQKYANSIITRLHQWMEFLSKDTSRELPLKTQLGLLGELSFIEYLSEVKNYAIKDILRYWIGPDRAAKDFALPNSYFEIKTCLDDENVVHISSEKQLSPEGKPSFLVVFKFLEDKNGITLENLVNKLLLKAQSEAGELREIFEQKLLAARYNSGIIYENLISVTPTITTFYEITDKFPAITASSIPAGVSDLKYNLSLSYCTDYIRKEPLL